MTDLMSAVEVRAAYVAVTERAKRLRPDATILGVTVEPMARIAAARELLVGARPDPVFGPAIVFGAGGTMVEMMGDSAVCLPPLNEVLARRLIDRTRVSRLLGPFRDKPAVDRQAVVDVLLRISDLICELPQIVELDINPLVAGPDATIVVDARIGIARPPANLRRHEHIAVPPQPSHLVKESVLGDGTRLTIRPIRPEDAQSEQTFVRELSPTAKKFRFMHAVNELTPEMLARFTQIDYGREMALIAVTHEPTGPVQQGVARYVINPDETSCEFAIVVSDRRQHQGIGTRLMQALIDTARGHGLKAVEGTVLAENQPMLQLMKGLGFSIAHSPDDRSLYCVERWL